MPADMIAALAIVIRFFLHFGDGRVVLQKMMAGGLSGIIDSSCL